MALKLDHLNIDKFKSRSIYFLTPEILDLELVSGGLWSYTLARHSGVNDHIVIFLLLYTIFKTIFKLVLNIKVLKNTHLLLLNTAPSPLFLGHCDCYPNGPLLPFVVVYSYNIHK